MLNQKDHGDDNWWTLSEGWPETNENAYAKWLFANKSNKLIPYGSYVLSGNTLRVQSKELLKLLNENFDIVRKAILQEMEDASDDMQIGDHVRYKWHANGSVGILTSRRRYDDGFYLKWCYGLDNYGNYMYSSDSKSRKDLEKITKTEYDAIVNKKKENK